MRAIYEFVLHSEGRQTHRIQGTARLAVRENCKRVREQQDVYTARLEGA